MFGAILRFELRYQLRRPVFHLSLAAAVAFAALMITALAQRAGEAQTQIDLHAPITKLRLVMLFAVFSLLIPLSLFGNALLRDQNTGMEELVKAAPVNLSGLLLARFCAAFLAATCVHAAVLPGIELALHMPWIDQAVAGSSHLAADAWIYAILLLPNLFLFGCALFAALNWTRSLAAGYVVLILFMALFAVANGTALNHPQFWYGALIDPFGMNAVNQIVRYWPPAEQNEALPPLEGLLLWNRLLWSGIGVVLLAVTAVFLPRRIMVGRAKVTELLPARAQDLFASLPKVAPGMVAARHQLLMRLRHETAVALRSWTFAFLLILLAATIFAYLAFPEQERQPFFPIATMIAPLIAALGAFYGLIVVMLLTGETMWRERGNRIAEILYATPAPDWVFYAGKFGAITITVSLYLLAAAATGVAFQLWQGSSDMQLGIYAVHALFAAGVPLVMYAVLTMLIHVLAPNKFLGHAAVLSILAAQVAAYYFGVEDGLLQFATLPEIPTSVMNGFGHYLEAGLWFAAYWGGVTLLMAVATLLLWDRGQSSTVRARIGVALRGRMRGAAAVSLLALLWASAAGGYIYWNTHVRHSFLTDRIIEGAQAAYERVFGASLDDPQPRVSAIELAVDLDPDRRILSARGRYTLVNRSGKPIETVRVQFYDDLRLQQVEMQGASLISFNPAFADYVFRPDVPLPPGGTATLTYAGTLSHAGFRHPARAVSINGNGTFVRNRLFTPSIGVMPSLFLTDQVRRRRHELPSGEGHGPSSRERTLFAHDADRLRLGITLSTAGDQTAVAPGVLKRQWVDGGRRYFRYETERPIGNFWCILSGRYRVRRAKWQDVDLSVYHHPPQGRNVPRMLSAMQQSLETYTESFGPYPFRQLGIAEFPYGSYAQSFPGIIAYAEAGFITGPYAVDVRDYVGFVTAHEVAHQWWGHAVAPADMPGGQFLSETLAEYSALMVMEKIHGPDHIRGFLQSDLDAYLASRAQGGVERPLAAVRPHEAHIAYKKGALAMYALKDVIGQGAMDRALRRYLTRYDRGAPPYPVAADLIGLLREEAGSDHHELIDDLFERITLWDFTTHSVLASPAGTGKWTVRVVVSGRKYAADAGGREQSVALDNLVDIGLFAADPADESFSPRDVIVLEKRRINQALQSFEFITDRRPVFGGINPYLKLIERNAQDNIATVRDEPGAP